MYRVILILLTVILHYPGMAQVTQGKAVYSINLRLDDRTQSKFSGEFRQVAAAAKSVRLELLFNNKESVFKLIDAMPTDAQDPKYYRMAEVLSSDGSYYVSNSAKLVQKTVERDETYLVRIPFDNAGQWELSKETRKIGDYQCFKATLAKSVSNSKEDIGAPVIAWYAPEIPVAFGPKGYHGLPGLILELQEDRRTYRCISIALNQPEKIAIARPEEGVSMTQVAFQQLMRKKLEDFKKNIR